MLVRLTGTVYLPPGVTGGKVRIRYPRAHQDGATLAGGMFEGLVSATGQLTATTNTNNVPDPLMVLGSVKGEKVPPVLVLTITPDGRTPYTLSVYPVPNISNPPANQADWVDVTLAPDNSSVIASQSLLDLLARTEAAAAHAQAAGGLSGTSAQRKAFDTSALTRQTTWYETDTLTLMTYWPSITPHTATDLGWRDPFRGNPDAAPPPPDTGAY